MKVSIPCNRSIRYRVRNSIAWSLLILLIFINYPAWAQSTVWPTQGWTSETPAQFGMNSSILALARNYALTGGGSGFITRSGRVVMSWGNTKQRYDLLSTSKSIGSIALGLAIQDGRVDLDDLAQQHWLQVGVPPTNNKNTGWLDDITLLQLATHTAGFDKAGGYINLLFKPGSKWSYSDGGANWLADVLTVVFKKDLNSLLFERVFNYIGVSPTDLTWRSNLYRSDTLNGVKRREFGSGISANIDAMAKIGYLYLRRGLWGGQRILPQGFIDQARQPIVEVARLPVNQPESYFKASSHYGLLWWNNSDGTLKNMPTDTYWSWGLRESLIVVIPSFDIVAARAGQGWRSGWDGNYSVLEPFLNPIVQSVGGVPTNQRPAAKADAFSVAKNSSNTLLVLANNGSGRDSDADQDKLTIITVGKPSAGGKVAIRSTGDALYYTPLAGYSGSETLAYTVSDGRGGISTARVTISVR